MKNEKNIDENLYNEKSLYLLNIKELRDLGRKIGVPAPATLKKQDLVDYILKIVYGQVDVPVRSSFGRPNVREVNMGQYLEKIKRKTDVYDELLNASFDNVESIFKVASPDESRQTNTVVQRIFIEEENKNYLRLYGFIKSEGDIEVSDEIKQKYQLENFDVVEVIISGKIFKIISVNGKIINYINSEDNENLGKKQVFHYRTKEEIRNEIIKLLKTSKDLRTIVFSRDDYSEFCNDYLKVDVLQSFDKAYKQFIAFVDLCEKYVYEGENIIVVTDESKFIEEVINSLDEDVSSRAKKHLQARINDLISLGNALVVYKQDVNFIYQ